MGRGTEAQESGGRDSGVRISLTSKARPGYSSFYPPGLPYEVPRVPTGYDPWGFYLDLPLPFFPGIPLTSGQKEDIFSLFPPRGSPELPWVPTGYDPWGFFFVGVPVGQAGDLPGGWVQSLLLGSQRRNGTANLPPPLARRIGTPGFFPLLVRPRCHSRGDPLLHRHSGFPLGDRSGGPPRFPRISPGIGGDRRPPPRRRFQTKEPLLPPLWKRRSSVLRRRKPTSPWG